MNIKKIVRDYLDWGFSYRQRENVELNVVLQIVCALAVAMAVLLTLLVAVVNIFGWQFFAGFAIVGLAFLLYRPIGLYRKERSQ